MSGIVADTSVWIAHFSGRTVPLLERALAEGTAVLPPLVIAELISGARKTQDRAAIADFLTFLPVHPTPLDHWVRVGELRRRLRNQGFSVSIPDAHVAQCALDRGAPLLSRDAVFKLIAQQTALILLPA